nr:hypothetical protein [Pirellula sp.]
MYDDEGHGPGISAWLAGCVQAVAIAFMLASPWWYGAAPWRAHAIAYSVGIVLFFSMVLVVLAGATSRRSDWWPTGLSWGLAMLGGFALWQSRTIYDWESTAGTAPPSVEIQRWALGSAPVPSAITEDLVQPLSTDAGSNGSTDCGWDAVPEEDRKLALSVEPSTTRAAAGSFFLAALLVWVGNATFSQKRTYPILLTAMTLLGS